jgi:hypothetical protein
MARGGTNRSINPAQLHATSGGQLETYSHALMDPLVQWTREAWDKDATSDEQAQLAAAWTYHLAGRMDRLPDPLREMATDSIIEVLRSSRSSGVPRALRPPLREMHRQMRPYAEQVGWTLPARMDQALTDQLSRPALDVADPDVLRLQTMRSATALVAALESAEETDVAELELLRAHALAGAEEAWARTRAGHDAANGLLDAGRWQLALAHSRSARIRCRRLAPAAAQLRHAMASQGVTADQAIVTAPDDDWLTTLTHDRKRAYAVAHGSMIVLSPDCYRDLTSTSRRRVKALRLAATEIALAAAGPAPAEATREQLIVRGAQAAHLADRALLDAQLVEAEDLESGGSFARSRELLADALARGSASDLLTRLPQRAGRSWQAAQANLVEVI